jgi:hypothetical protein
MFKFSQYTIKAQDQSTQSMLSPQLTHHQVFNPYSIQSTQFKSAVKTKKVKVSTYKYIVESIHSQYIVKTRVESTHSPYIVKTRVKSTHSPYIVKTRVESIHSPYIAKPEYITVHGQWSRLVTRITTRAKPPVQTSTRPN